MKVSELIQKLQQADPELQVLIVDADTAWPLAVLEVDIQPKYVSLGGDYHEDENPEGWPT